MLEVGDEGSLLDGLLYVVAVEFVSSWPLVVRPLVAAPVQQWVIRCLTRYPSAVERWSGVLLIVTTVVGVHVDGPPDIW